MTVEALTAELGSKAGSADCAPEQRSDAGKLLRMQARQGGASGSGLCGGTAGTQVCGASCL